MTSYWRRLCGVVTSHRRPFDVVRMSCAWWECCSLWLFFIVWCRGWDVEFGFISSWSLTYLQLFCTMCYLAMYCWIIYYISQTTANVWCFLKVSVLQDILWFTQKYLTLKAPNKNCSRRHLFFFIFRRKKAWFFHVNPLPSRGFTWNIKSYFNLRDSQQNFSKVGLYFPYISCCGFTSC